MDEKTFNEDLNKIYEFTTNKYIDNTKYLNLNDSNNNKFLEEFLISNNIRVCDESMLAIAVRLVNLKNDSIVQFLKKEKFNEIEINNIKYATYNWVKEYYENYFDDLISKINDEELLSDFYREILINVNLIGKEFNKWLPNWKKKLIYGVNIDLKKEFKSDEKVISFIRDNNLFDIGHYDEEADRSYSILIKNKNGNYISNSYYNAFEECENIVHKLKEFKLKLSNINDEVFGLENEYDDYLSSLINAFSETETNKLVDAWSKVDEKWMSITSPIQMGHPLEYYDDHYRKAVQLEWDIRIVNPKFSKNLRSVSIKKMYKEIFDEIGKNFMPIYNLSLNNVDRTQLYLGKPLLYYGSELEGLFSAQVVPNDMVASEKYGKKIFAFADLVLDSSRNRPLMKLPKLIYEEDYVKQRRKFLFNETDKWYRSYDIETIGHEYGHILWLDKDTETHMNKTGNFKNIEEFKATTGGLVSFFVNPEEDLKLEIVRGLVNRAVGLIAWMKVGNVLPYYCEGLIHLTGLFETEVIKFDKDKQKLIVNLTNDSYEKIKDWYLSTYKKLAITYLNKKNADDFLFNYCIKEGDFFLPVNKEIKEFVLHVYDLYEKHGNEVDKNDSKENYIVNLIKN